MYIYQGLQPRHAFMKIKIKMVEQSSSNRKEQDTEPFNAVPSVYDYVNG